MTKEKTTLTLKNELMPHFTALCDAHFHAYERDTKGDANHWNNVAVWKEKKNKFYSWWNKLSSVEKECVGFLTVENGKSFKWYADNVLFIHLD